MPMSRMRISAEIESGNAPPRSCVSKAPSGKIVQKQKERDDDHERDRD